MALRVAVIGAGAAGLCVARHVLSKPQTFSAPVVFESRPTIGGTWVYEECTGNHDNGPPIHSKVMMFPDLPFDPELDSFIPHQEVLRYLEKYCKFFKISPHIRVSVLPSTLQKNIKSIKGPISCKIDFLELLAMLLCYFLIKNTPRAVFGFIHAVLSNPPESCSLSFSGRTALVLGARASGIDICHELSTVAAQVFLSHRESPLTFPLPPNLQQTPPIHSIQQDGTVLLQGGRVVSPDVLLLCTGYEFSFPFLSGPELGVRIEPKFVGPLYQLVLPPSFPSIFFIGVCQQILPFPHFHCQVLLLQYYYNATTTTILLLRLQPTFLKVLRNFLRLYRRRKTPCHNTNMWFKRTIVSQGPREISYG
uniref:Flavin-containing monooxygenase n=1 Tax=Neogobius melanostomus TaxID=47308 RepID=A0A8C6TIQ5_9GOBI